MATQTLEMLLGAKAMTGIIQSPELGVMEDVLPAGFYAVNQRVPGNEFEFYLVDRDLGVARRVNQGSPSVPTAIEGATPRTAKVPHTAEHHIHSPQTLQNLKRFDSPQVQRLARQVIDMQVRQFRGRTDRWRIAMCQCALLKGYLYWDINGDLLTSSGSAVHTIDYERPTTGTDICVGNLTTATTSILAAATGETWAAAKWSAAGTDIAIQMRELVNLQRRRGFPIRYAFYGDNVLSYLLANTQIMKMFPVGSSALADLQSNVIPDGFLGVPKWKPAGTAFFRDSDKAYQAIADDDRIVFTPAPDPSWWQYVEGAHIIPRNFGTVSRDASAALANIDVVQGRFSYAMMTDGDPVSIKHIAGDTSGPFQLVKTAVLDAAVHW